MHSIKLNNVSISSDRVRFSFNHDSEKCNKFSSVVAAVALELCMVGGNFITSY